MPDPIRMSVWTVTKDRSDLVARDFYPQYPHSKAPEARVSEEDVQRIADAVAERLCRKPSVLHVTEAEIQRYLGGGRA